MDLNHLSGRMHTSLTLESRATPYQILADLTVMPGSILTLKPGVVLEFAPQVGLLVLGRLVARGERGKEIIMRPLSQPAKQKPAMPLMKL